jgi:hypothetical protein
MMSVCMFRNTAYAHATHARRSAAIHVQIHNQNHTLITDGLRGSSDSSTRSRGIIHTRTHARTHARRHTHTHIHLYIGILAHISTYILVYTNTLTHSHTHTYIHIHS